ncbi:hypothetical protein CYLTODRAFT_451551 [Cylindrobasidium torrendii FP15055 ss-10]|uniref:Uncharacterized protein n=1 Tax=Cylindrobasidium torrendii FP15055 ss-10 TaxID=1314674 RepID=A0A0D7BJI7_9AGAR|nr:hypothetical protein CYLTODRAFT_451551 [Cylindrobasidium torrendii FP15055 ss-10]
MSKDINRYTALPPSLRALVLTNDVPSSAQLLALAQILPSMTAQLDQLDADIARVQGELLRLTKSREDLAATIQDLQCSKHPVRTLPDDILRVIFEECVPWCRQDGISEESFPDHCSLDAVYAPWTISHVCRNWRAVATSYPLLWSTHHITARTTGATLERLQERIAVIHKRSESLPLRICISNDVDAPLFESLVGSCGRWKCARIDAKYLDFLATFQNREFPLLEGFSFCWNQYCEASIELDFAMPALRHLEYWFADFGDVSGVPCHQILVYKSIFSDLDYVHDMVNLQKLTVHRSTWYNDELVATPDNLPTTLAHLVHLEIIETSEFDDFITDYNEIFKRFDMPCLHTLVLDTCLPRIPTGLPSSLSNLTIIHQTTGNLDHIFSQLPRDLQQLHIGGYDPASVLEVLYARTHVLSRLQHLQLTVKYNSIGAILQNPTKDALESAKERNVPLLETLSIFFDKDAASREWTHKVRNSMLGEMIEDIEAHGTRVEYVVGEHYFRT